MEIILSNKAKSDLLFWQKSVNKIILKKISQLIRSIQTSPYEGIGNQNL